MKSLFRYTDYREYLRDYYAHGKAHYKLSYRVLARRCGFTSPNFIKLLIENKANLSPDGIDKVNTGLNHNPKEAAFFATLVQFNQSRSVDQKLSLLEQLRSYATTLDAATVDPGTYEYYSDINNALLRELLDAVSCNGDLRAIRSLMKTRLTLPDIKKKIKLLIRLGFLREDGEGNYRVVDRHITTGRNVDSEIIRHFHVEMAKAGADAIVSVPPQERDVSGITMTVSESCFHQMQREIERFRKRMTEMAERDGGADRVYRLNVQLFPLSEQIPPRLQKKDNQEKRL